MIQARDSSDQPHRCRRQDYPEVRTGQCRRPNTHQDDEETESSSDSDDSSRRRLGDTRKMHVAGGLQHGRVACAEFLTQLATEPTTAEKHLSRVDAAEVSAPTKPVVAPVLSHASLTMMPVSPPFEIG